MKVCQAKSIKRGGDLTKCYFTGPQGIPGPVPFEPGHLISNEPGFYLEGQWGIRTESVLICKPVKVRESHVIAKTAELMVSPTR